MSKNENLEEILADFQACTGIDDVGLAILHLDEAEWDLVRAVSKVMPPGSQSFQFDKSEDSDVMIVEDNETPVIVENTSKPLTNSSFGNNIKYSSKTPSYFREQPSTSKVGENKRTVKFKIQYNDKVAPIELLESSNIYDLKIAIQKEFKVPPCRQLLVGWTKNDQDENIPFSKLVIDDENSLDLHVKTNEDGFEADQENKMTERLMGMFTLHIKHDENVYKLSYKGTTKVLEIKIGTYALTNIEVRNQVWNGWPPNTDDQMLLAVTGINYPEHNFELSRNITPSCSNKDKEKKIGNSCSSRTSVIKIDSDEEEYEDASETFTVDDDCFIDEVVCRRTEPLIPDNVEDEIVGSLTFIERFTTRYGPIHPPFFQGNLEEAIQESCNKAVKDRKILAIYLHHDSSVLTNVFCTQLLGFESVIQIIEKNFILWGWDLTFDSNLLRLQQSVTSNLGALAANSLRNMPMDRLPALILIMRVRSSTEIFSVIHGNVGVSELLSSLIEAVEVFSNHQRVEMKEEQERAERELVKWEQDQAYRESLEADRAKEQAKRSKEEAEQEEKRRLENQQAEEMRRKEKIRKEIEKNLPSEPSVGEGDKENIVQIRFRLPKGENIERRFHVTTPLKVLLDFLLVKGYPSEEYKVISSWPRRDLTVLDSTKTLRELNLYPQETVILEER